MKLGPRDGRALLLLLLGGLAVLIFRLVAGGDEAPRAVGSAGSIPTAERRLERVRERAATVGGKEEILKQVGAELAEREKSILQAETAAQAQAHLLDIIRRVARGQAPPLEFGTVELQQPSRFGDYGEVRVVVPFNCHTEELVNFLADLTQQPEAIATTELRISALDPKQKTIAVRLTLSGIVPRRLVPVKKGVAAF